MVVRCTNNDLNIYRPGQTAMALASRLDCSLFQAALLEMRGVTASASDSTIDGWLSPDMERILDSLELGESNARAAEIFRGLSEDSDVVVYGDYDVDGISSTTIAMELALLKHAHVRYFIPHRFNQGYGLHSEVAIGIAKRKCDLVIVVDCGTQDVEAVRLIKDSGIPVVIFDHHLVEGETAGSDTMINPQAGGDQLAKGLCATGVIWCWAWQNRILPAEQLVRMLDLVALATIADCVTMASPLNRVLVQEGLGVLRRSPRPGLEILMQRFMLAPQALDTEDLAMKIIPCLNAAGRLYLADLAVKLFFPGKDLAATADKIIELNNKRRELSSRILTQVDDTADDGFRFVLTNSDWSVGVLSSVASRICSERGAPIALVAAVGDIMRGTLRMPNGGDAVGVLKNLAPMLNTWGGHRLAAGFSVKLEKWPELRKQMEDTLSHITLDREKEDILYWDTSEIDMDTWQQGERLGPFGMGNPAPRLYSPFNGQIRVSPMRNGKHVKINLGGSVLLGFGAADLIEDREGLLGWVYKPRIDTWHNITSLQLVLEKMVMESA